MNDLLVERREREKRRSKKKEEKKEGTACRAPTIREKQRPKKRRLGFLGLAAEECGDVQVVGGDFVADFADVLLDLVDYVGQRLLLRNGSFYFAAGFPGFG